MKESGSETKKNVPVPPPTIFSRAEQLRVLLSFTTQSNLNSQPAGPYLEYYHKKSGYPVPQRESCEVAEDSDFYRWRQELIPSDYRTELPTIEANIMEIPCLRYLFSNRFISHMPTGHASRKGVCGMSVPLLVSMCQFLMENGSPSGKEVHENLILLGTAKNACRFIDLVHNEHLGTPTLYISHNWERKVAEMLSAVIDHPLSQQSLQAATGTSDHPLGQVFVWVDLFCVNYHDEKAKEQAEDMLFNQLQIPRHASSMIPAFAIPWPSA